MSSSNLWIVIAAALMALGAWLLHDDEDEDTVQPPKRTTVHIEEIE